MAGPTLHPIGGPVVPRGLTDPRTVSIFPLPCICAFILFIGDNDMFKHGGVVEAHSVAIEFWGD